jgi:hypothetical protein
MLQMYCWDYEDDGRLVGLILFNWTAWKIWKPFALLKLHEQTEEFDLVVHIQHSSRLRKSLLKELTEEETTPWTIALPTTTNTATTLHFTMMMIIIVSSAASWSSHLLVDAAAATTKTYQTIRWNLLMHIPFLAFFSSASQSASAIVSQQSKHC